MGQVRSILWGPEWTQSRQVRVETGLVSGKTFTMEDGTQVDAFLGIPFAKAPEGPLRFKKPVPVEEWEGVRDCTRFGPRCPHEDISIEKLTFFHPKSEDCLTLNVFAPSIDDQDKRPLEKLPVCVFIHGGAFAVHSAAHYGDYGICKILCTKGVVVVTVQYRLGFFGFLTTADEHCRGNWGLWDQTLALKWVQQNIDRFGGDPRNVTLFGQSAGGASTDYLSLSPHSRDLFHKMVPMSGSAMCSFAINDAEHVRDLCLNFAVQHGFEAPTEGGQDALSRSMVEFFSELPMSVCEMSMLGKYGVNDGGRIDLTPVFDGDFFPRPFEELRREAAPKPMMTGITEYEGLLFTAIKPPRHSFRHELRRQIQIEFHKRHIHDPSREQKAMDMYLGDVQRENRKAYVNACLNLISDMIINNGVWELADWAARRGGAPVYLYSFDYFNPYGFGMAGLLFPFKGATHCSELPYLFGKGIIANFRPSLVDAEMIHIFSTYFTNFAKYGNPNGRLSPNAKGLWEPTTAADTSRYFHIDVVGSEMRRGFCAGRPRRWRSILQRCPCNSRVCTAASARSPLYNDKSPPPSLIEDSVDPNNNNPEDPKPKKPVVKTPLSRADPLKLSRYLDDHLSDTSNHYD